ncbi:hypothetical protein BZA77DRAFT_376241, partial [Pyronema omphalodes]
VGFKQFFSEIPTESSNEITFIQYSSSGKFVHSSNNNMEADTHTAKIKDMTISVTEPGREENIFPKYTTTYIVISIVTVTVLAHLAIFLWMCFRKVPPRRNSDPEGDHESPPPTYRSTSALSHFQLELSLGASRPKSFTEEMTETGLPLPQKPPQLHIVEPVEPPIFRDLPKRRTSKLSPSVFRVPRSPLPLRPRPGLQQRIKEQVVEIDKDSYDDSMPPPQLSPRPRAHYDSTTTKKDHLASPRIKIEEPVVADDADEGRTSSGSEDDSEDGFPESFSGAMESQTDIEKSLAHRILIAEKKKRLQMLQDLEEREKTVKAKLVALGCSAENAL